MWLFRRMYACRYRKAVSCLDRYVLLADTSGVARTLGGIQRGLCLGQLRSKPMDCATELWRLPTILLDELSSPVLASCLVKNCWLRPSWVYLVQLRIDLGIS